MRISEPASGIRRRGRPAIFSEETLHVLELMGFSRRVTHRQRQQRANAMRAFGALQRDDGHDPSAYAWLVCDAQFVFRVSVLAELGRLSQDAEIRRFARRLCQLQPPVKRAAQLVRDYRLGRLRAGDAYVLFRGDT